MKLYRGLRLMAAALGLCLVAGGCFQPGDSPLDEQKEPHFLAGKNLAVQLDYAGAINSFEKALEANPRNASAHFELALLYEVRANDPAAAIYHYERFLKFRPKDGNAEVVRQHINSCKQQLAASSSLQMSFSPAAQQQLERLQLTNKLLEARLAQFDPRYRATHQLGTETPPPPAPGPTTEVPRNPQPATGGASGGTTAHSASPGGNPTGGNHPAAPAAKTHVVKAGDNPTTIAREHGISVKALLAANPQMKSNHLVPGQTLVIPAP